MRLSTLAIVLFAFAAMPVPAWTELSPPVPDTGSAGIPAGLFKEPSPRILEKIEVDRVWSGHPVGFSLLTQGDRQFAAYYDAERHMTVASRKLDEKDWHRVRLPEVLNWDSHNSVTLAVDSAGCLHLSGNMHVRPLVYFRTAKALDIDSFERAPMTGARENRVTYPAFLNGPSGELIFTYRDGSSGNGDQVYNVYDTTQRTWRRLLDTSLCTGNGKMNAYLSGPARGPDGLFHLCWVWRDTPDCATNHDLSYARSRDMIHWENAAGEALELPITLESRGVVVDPVPPGGGVINGNTKLGFDHRNRPVVSYHKYDAAGKTQLYNARLEDGSWKICQTSDWDYRWEFSGGGSIPFEIRVSPVSPAADGFLRQPFSHPKCGGGIWKLDEATLKPVGTVRDPDPLPGELGRLESEFPDMHLRRAQDLGGGPEAGTRFLLQWETLGPNRDRPREGALPPPSALWLLKTGPALEP
jgi:hypothetical protein